MVRLLPHGLGAARVLLLLKVGVRLGKLLGRVMRCVLVLQHRGLRDVMAGDVERAVAHLVPLHTSSD